MKRPPPVTTIVILMAIALLTLGLIWHVVWPPVGFVMWAAASGALGILVLYLLDTPWSVLGGLIFVAPIMALFFVIDIYFSRAASFAVYAIGISGFVVGISIAATFVRWLLLRKSCGHSHPPI
jgi:hypothetical protein